jgi:hypothetical protein
MFKISTIGVNLIEQINFTLTGEPTRVGSPFELGVISSFS